MAYMTATGGDASSAGTKLQAFMVALQRPSDSLSAALKKVGITSGSAMLAEYGLAESAEIVSRAFGGNQDAMVQAVGRIEAVNAVISLTGDAYGGFAQQFGEGMSGITAASRAVQVESYESKIGRLNAATDALKIQVGDDVNFIKGLFVDMGAGFLTYVVGPIMSSPLGGVFQGLAAGVGLAAKSVLDVGSGVLNTASQLAVLTAAAGNAGGFINLFKNSVSLLTSPLKGVASAIAGMIGPLLTKISVTFAATAAESGYAAAMWAAAGATWAALWPVLAVIAGVALLAGGAYLLIKNWDAVSAFFVNLWGKVTGAFSAAWGWIKNTIDGMPGWAAGLIAAFFPAIGLPMLIIKNWDAVAAFFPNLWTKIKTAFSLGLEWIKNVFNGLPNWVIGLAAVFVPFITIPFLIIKNWGAIKDFFAFLWGQIVSGVSAFVGRFSGAWAAASSVFTAVWGFVSGFFAGIWQGFVSIVMEFTGWIGGMWSGITGGFTAAWGIASGFFAGIWQRFVSIVMEFTGWIGGMWSGIAGGFTAAWDYVYNFFFGIWEKIKSTVLGFVDWLGPVADIILAPFRAIGWVLDKIGGQVKEVVGGNGPTVELSNTAARTGTMAAAAPVPAVAPVSVTATGPAAPVFTGLTAPPAFSAAPSDAAVPPALPAAPAFTGTAITPTPETATALGAVTAPPVSPASQTYTALAGADSPAMNYAASNAFTDAIAAAGLDRTAPWHVPSYDEEAALRFREALPDYRAPRETALKSDTALPARPVPPVVNIQNLTVNADEIEDALDLIKILLQAAHRPEEAV
jgi:hypothetical protein